MSEERATGRVILVGAGPGDPDLITVRGAAAIGRADVVLYDELACADLLALARDAAVCINVGKRGHDAPTRTQDDINALLVEHARAGRLVVRLKGGDPFVFGRGGEEATACVEAGVPFEVIPGISSALAALAYSGIPITDRRHAASFAVVTGHKDPTRVSEETRWSELGSSVDTLVILMGMKTLPAIADRLIAGGKPGATPAAAIMNGSLPTQRVVVSTLRELAGAVAEAGLGAPAAIVVGGVVALREQLAWWEASPLFGMRALITRAPHQVSELASALRAAGALPVAEPLIALEPCDDPSALAAVDEALHGLAGYDDVLFSSSNSVRFFASHAARAGVALPDALRGRRVLCLGRKTADAALAHDFPIHFVGSGGQDSASMLDEMRSTLPTAGRRVLIPRSDIGLDVLPTGLREAGCDVDAVTFYRNVRPAVDADALRSAITAGLYELITFTSPSAVSHFEELLDGPARRTLEGCIIAAIGRTTAGALRNAGLRADVVPERPDVRSLVEAVIAHVVSREVRP